MDRSRWRNWTVMLAICVLSSTLQACGSSRNSDKLFEPVRFTKQEQAGSSHVAVLSVARWEDYAKSLQPTFKLTEAEALQLSVATTRAFEEKFIDTLSVLLKVAPPTSSETLTKSTQTVDGQTTKTETRTETEGPGDASGALFSQSPASGTPATSVPPTSLLSGDLALDPMMRYWLATALYQEVQLLNRYILDAVQKNKDKYDAYIVRMQVSLLPSARNEPYDAYSTFSFFVGKGNAGTPGTHFMQYRMIDTVPVPAPPLPNPGPNAEMRRGLPEKSTPAAYRLGEPGAELAHRVPFPPRPEVEEQQVDLTPEELAGKWVECRTQLESILRDVHDADLKKEAEELAGESDELLQRGKIRESGVLLERCSSIRFRAGIKAGFADQWPGTPFVVPLLVTDNLEATIHSRTLDQIRQYALGLALLIQGFGAEGEFTKFNQDLQAVLGRDLNSLLTVARVSDNTYRVRLGAMQQVTSGYAMVPRTHNVTFLLLVPKTSHSDKVVQVVSRTSMVDATNGEELAERTEREVTEELSRAMGRYRLYGLESRRVSPRDARQLLSLAQRNNSNDFFNYVEDHLSKEADIATFPKEALWLDLIEVMVGSRYASTSFELPAPKAPVVFCRQAALVLDDPKGSASVILRGGEYLSASKLSASLWPVGPEAGPPFAVERIEVFASQAEARFSFPSLAAWGVSVDASKFLLEIHCPGCKAPEVSACEAPGSVGSGFRYAAFYKVKPSEVAQASEKPRFGLEISPKFIMATPAGEGKLNLEFTTVEKSITIGFNVTGADIEAMVVNPEDATPDRRRRVLNKSAVVELTLRNLNPQTPVQIYAFEEKPGAEAGSTVKVPLNPGPGPLPVLLVEGDRSH